MSVLCNNPVYDTDWRDGTTAVMTCGQLDIDGREALCDICSQPSLFNAHHVAAAGGTGPLLERYRSGELAAQALSSIMGASWDIGGYVAGERVTP